MINVVIPFALIDNSDSLLYYWNASIVSYPDMRSLQPMRILHVDRIHTRCSRTHSRSPLSPKSLSTIYTEQKQKKTLFPSDRIASLIFVLRREKPKRPS